MASPEGEGPGSGGGGKSGTQSRRGWPSRRQGDHMGAMNRRDVVQLLAVAPLATAFRWAPESVREAAALARETLARAAPYEPKNFTAHEWETVRLLVDLIIPKDERSGSATEAGVPEFMDFMLGDDPGLQTPIRGGLAWLARTGARRGGTASVP